jgi:hypothetical protein
MTEESQEVPENIVKEHENPENAAENAAENEAVNEAVNSKRRGRPAGSKDKAPRKKKVVVVEAEVSEPMAPPEDVEQHKPPPKQSPKPSKPSPKPSPNAQPSVEPEPSAQPSAQPSADFQQLEPLSPNTIVREASRHILKLKSISAQARRDHIFQTYTAKLHAI